MDATTSGSKVSTGLILNSSLVVMIGGTVSLLAMQAIRGDWFPPEVSISQYGVGDYGWTLTTTLLFLATASALLLWGSVRQSTGGHWPVIVAWGVWTVALMIMAFVPTNEWPAPLSLAGKIHQGAAVCGLFAAPIGAVLMVGVSRRDAQGTVAARARIVAIVCAALSWVFLGLLLLTNVDIDITGLGYRRAWSLHQTVAVVLDIVMVFALIICLRDRSQGSAQPEEREAADTSPLPSPSSSRVASQ